MDKKFTLQLELVDLNENKAMKVFVLDPSTKQSVDKEIFRYNNLTFTTELMISDINRYIEENHFILEKKVNFVVTSSNVFQNTIVLPKSPKMAQFLDNEIADQFKDDYKDNFCLFTSTSSYLKDGTLNYISLIPNALVKQIYDIVAGLKLDVGQITSTPLIYAEKEASNTLISSKKAPYISVHISDLYTVVTLIKNKNLIASYVSDTGHEILTKENVVKRMPKIQYVNSLVISLAGQNEMLFKNGPVEDFYLYCDDEALRSQFGSKKLNIPYFYVENNGFEACVFKKNVYNCEKILSKLRKGSTLVESIVALTVFSIISLSLFGLISSCLVLAGNDEINLKANTFVSDITNRFEVKPTKMLSEYYAEVLGTGDYSIYDLSTSAETTLKLDSDFLPTLNEETYVVTFTQLVETTIEGTSFKKYTSSISSIVDKEGETYTKGAELITVIHNDDD